MDNHPESDPVPPPAVAQPNGLRDWNAELAYIQSASAKRGVIAAFHFSAAHFVGYCERRAVEAKHAGNAAVAEQILAACKAARQ